YGKVPNLLQDDQNYTSRDIFETINIKSTANHEIKMPAIKRSHGRPPNNKRIRSADEENKENRMSSKKYSSEQKIEKSNLNTFKTISIDNAANCNKLEIPAVKYGRGRPPKTDAIKQNSENNGVYINPNIPQDAILQVYDPIGDGYCGFRSLAIAILKDKNRWQGVKVIVNDYLSKQEEMYSNILGYDVKRLIDILLYAEPECSQDYWFYIPECAQLASHAFNVPVVIFGADPTASLFSYHLIKNLAA
ncbi:19311_t:CDS:1, partial [Gigaspora margarita]